MLDFFKDLYLEASGLDMEQMRKERKEKIEIEKEETIILKPKSKKNLIEVGMIFIVIHILGIVVSVASQDSSGIIKSAVMISLAIVAMICLMIRNKVAEIVSIILCVLVVLLSVAISYF